MKSTNDLDTILKSKNDIKSFLKENKDDMVYPTFTEQLNLYIKEKNISRSALADKTDINKRFLYEIFDGSKTPSRDKVLQLCLALNLSQSESNHLLNSAGVSELYPRDPRDSIVIFCILNNKSVMDCNEEFYDTNLPIFS